MAGPLTPAAFRVSGADAVVRVHGAVVQVVLQRWGAGGGRSSDPEPAPSCPLPVIIPGSLHRSLGTLGHPIRSSLSPRDLHSSPHLEPGDQSPSSPIPRDPQSSSPGLPGTTPPFSLIHRHHAPPSPAALSLSPQCSRPERVPGTQKEAPCRPSSPHGAGHCTPQPPTGHCHQAQPPHGSIDHWEVLLGLEYRFPPRDVRLQPVLPPLPRLPCAEV